MEITHNGEKPRTTENISVYNGQTWKNCTSLLSLLDVLDWAKNLFHATVPLTQNFHSVRNLWLCETFYFEPICEEKLTHSFKKCRRQKNLNFIALKTITLFCKALVENFLLFCFLFAKIVKRLLFLTIKMCFITCPGAQTTIGGDWFAVHIALPAVLCAEPVFVNV
jgi:hypothetical protein